MCFGGRSHRQSIIEGVLRVNRIWSQSIAIPISVAIVVGAVIVGIGETYLALGDYAIYLAIVLMFGIAGVAAYFSTQSENRGRLK